MLLLVFLTSCNIFVVREPVEKINNSFLDTHGAIIKSAKDRHKKNMENSKYTGQVNFEKTAMGRMRAKEMEFLEKNMANKPYFDVDTAGGDGENVKYLTYNNGPYKTAEYDYFGDVTPNDNSFRYYSLGDKEYTEISNKELQDDYYKVIELNKTSQYNSKVQSLKMEKEERDNEGILNKMTNGLKKFGDKLKNLLK
jgi:hypothetical protein